MPPPPPAASNIRAFVQWREPTVYSGEDIECIITFKNVARRPGSDKDLNTPTAAAPNGTTHSRRTSNAPTAGHSRKSSVVQVQIPAIRSRAPSTAGGRPGPAVRGHRPALSLNVVSAPARVGTSNSASAQDTVPLSSTARPGKGHGRSLSIMSLGSEPASEAKVSLPFQSKRPVRPHARSASLSYTPKFAAQSPAQMSMPSPRQPSPLYEATTPPLLAEGRQQTSLRPARRRPGTVSADNTPQLGRESALRKQVSNGGDSDDFQSFKFPMVPPSDSGSAHGQANGQLRPVRKPSNMHSSGNRSFSPRPQDSISGGLSNLNPITRVMSETSNDGTPRTSSEFYSMSNHSDETLTSELPSQQPFGRLLPKLTHSRQHSRSPQNRPAQPETLMMGYVQTMGQFTLDGSLVNTAPFEDVKRKGVQGDGGVVGIERSKRSSGLFGALSWGNIGESLGGLLGGDEISSMAQMKATAGSRTIPLLSTPQSLLFVDLRLAPGESRSYNYRFPLPRGLPPSHRGRAIKVSYHLSLGVQRPDGQPVKHVEIPFRILGSYDARGDALGHDLMSPYILLQDSAHTKSLAPLPANTNEASRFLPNESRKKPKSPKQGLEDFLRYTERLSESSTDANGVLLSPTSPATPRSARPPLSRQSSGNEQPPASIREAIDLAILRSNTSTARGKQTEAQSANRFNISRAGQPVCVITILRPSYRLGEAVTGTIDFTAAVSGPDSRQAPTYSVLVELESAEHIDPSLSLRSALSINRVTRKVYASARENCLFARQVGFNLCIPSHATPSFETTGVSFGWQLKVEFTTQRQSQGLGIEGRGSGEELLEELGRDERGTAFIAKERLGADTFEIAVPLKVFGTVGLDPFNGMSDTLYV